MLRKYFGSVSTSFGCLINSSLTKDDQYLISLNNFKILSGSQGIRIAKLIKRGCYLGKLLKAELVSYTLNYILS